VNAGGGVTATAAAGSDWRKLGGSDDFYAAFVFMDEARRSRYGDVSPTNTPAFATKMANASDADLVFAHALVGPSDLLIGVRAKSFIGGFRVAKAFY
jgi:hypothetical protein